MKNRWIGVAAAALLAAGAFATGASRVVIPDCVGYWSFDEGQGTEAKDASSTQNHGKLKGNCKWEDGKFGKALSFDGAGACVEVAKDLSVWLGKSGSLAFWIKTKQEGSDTAWEAPGVSGVEENGGENDIFWGVINGSGKICVQAGNGEPAASSTTINDDKWRHVVLTRNKDGGEVKVYVDGKLETTATSEADDKTSSFKALGARGNTDGEPGYFKGMLDEVKAYSRVLKAEEVEILFKNEDK
jgi:hypothetical protein